MKFYSLNRKSVVWSFTADNYCVVVSNRFSSRFYATLETQYKMSWGFGDSILESLYDLKNHTDKYFREVL